jgi:hypothetical protein
LGGRESSVERDRWTKLSTIYSAVLAIASLFVAVLYSLGCIDVCYWKPIGGVIVGGWAIIPPVWLFYDWVFFRDKVSRLEWDAIKHTHDLVRNLWLGLLGVLTALFGFRPLG